MYAYTQAGLVLNKRLRLWKQTGTQTPTTFSADLEAGYTYDQEGKMSTQSYPLGTTYSYTYDSMGRPIQMMDTQAGSNLVSSVTYGPAGELLSMSGTSVGETRTYNSMGQLVTLSGLNGVNLKYNYAAAGSNNGQIASQQDLVSGETVSYQYDSLKRLSAATSTQGWNQNFGYDGFGNLTAKTGNGGAPVGSYPADPATNRLLGIQYDTNGNQLAGGTANQLGYDVSNRMVGSSGSSLQGSNEYDASNKRVYQLRQHFDGNVWVTDATEYYFYGVSGKKVGTYYATVSGSGAATTMSWSLSSTQVFFKGKLISRSTGAAQEDIRGSVGSYYPYGEDRTATANDAIKFATYVRDSVSGLDYARHRYHLPGMGRFLTPDPSRKSARSSNPPSWNRYPYVQGDPINGTDRHGLNRDECDEEEDCCDDYGENCTGGGDGGGGGGGGGDGDGQSFEWCDDGSGCSFESGLVDKEALSALNGLTQGCTRLFNSTNVPSTAGTFGGYNPLSSVLVQVASSTTYIDAQTQGSQTLAQATGLNISGTQTVAQTLGTYGAATITVNGQTVNYVILSGSFFNLGKNQQDTLLLHELLHVVLQDHPDIARTLGFAAPSETSDQGWSNAIAEFLNGNCGQR